MPLLLAIGCGANEARTVTLEVRLHEHQGCPLPEDKSDVAVLLQPLGRFPKAPPVTVPATAMGRALALPEATLGLEVRVVDGSLNTWLGSSERRAEDGFDVLLWREGATCALPADDDYPGASGGQALGYSPRSGVLLAAGADLVENSAAWAFAFDVDNGSAEVVAGTDVGLARPRAHATVTEFGEGLLVAGGENPLVSGVPEDERELEGTAQIYVPASHAFGPEIIDLVVPRTRHAALTLPSGETLLIGGRSGFRDFAALFEAISPRTLLASLGVFASLEVDRSEPVALTLDDGRIFVGGGRDLDGAPISTLEWFSSDAREHLLRAELGEHRHFRAFAALPGGGVLSAGGCAPDGVDPAICTRFCSDAEREALACDNPAPDAWWIAPDGGVNPVTFDVPESTCGRPFSPARVALASGSNGSPWLLAVDGAAPPCSVTLRFDPWRARLVAAGVPSSFDPRLQPVSLGADSFVWVTAEEPPRFAGLRAEVRGPFSPEPATPLVESVVASDRTRPQFLAPDRPAGDAVVFDASSPRRLIFAPGAPVRVFVTDARYEDSTVHVEVAPSDEAADELLAPVVLFGEALVGHRSLGEPCAWPGDGGLRFTATRRAGVVTLEREGATGRGRCEVPAGPVAVGLQAGTPSDESDLRSTVVVSLEVLRN